MLIEDLELFQTVVEESPIAMALFSGPEMTVLLVNKTMLSLWNQASSVIGQPFRMAIPSLYSKELDYRLNQVYNAGVSFEITEQRLDLVFNNQLQAHYHNIIFKPLKNPEGNVWGILATAIDVTAQVLAQKEAEVKEQLHQSDQKFRGLISQAPVAIGVFGGWDMVIESANESLLKLWGKDESVIGLPLLTALPEIKGMGFIELLQKVYATGEAYYGYEMLSKLYWQKHKKDAYFNFVYQPVIEADGKTNKILVVANEITAQVEAKKELEESKNHFKNLMLEAPMAMALFTGSNFVIDVANEAMIKLWGKDVSIIGKPLAIALPELEGQPYLPLLDEIYATGVAYHSSESKADLMVDGKLQSFYFNFTNKPILDKEGKVYCIINMAVDVTSQVMARAELEEIAKKKDEFLSVASHELKTPLTSMKASMQIINRMFKTDPTSAVIPVFAHKANSSLVKIIHLVDDLMQVSKIQQGQLPLHKTWFKLADLVLDCCDHLRIEGTHELILEGDTELEVYADFARIDQVVVNFVNNAVKYAPASKKIIKRIEKTAEGAKVSVQDFGIGIPLEKQKHLFDRYFRVDSSGVQFSGLGLGLYICEEIIKRHGGTIGVNSTVGEGSTFWFTLPL